MNPDNICGDTDEELRAAKVNCRREINGAECEPRRRRVLAHLASMCDYELRVRALEQQGLTRSDAQGCVDAEDVQQAEDAYP